MEESIRPIGVMKQPFSKTWWVKDGQLLAGCFPGTPGPNGLEDRLTQLVDAGIRTFISLQPADERNTRSGAVFPDYEPILKRLEGRAGGSIRFHRFPVPDVTAPPPAVARDVLDAIDESLENGMPAYVHCWGGHGRTGTVIGCWLVRHGASGAEALASLSRLRKRYPELADEPAPQVAAQRELILRWSELDTAGAGRQSIGGPETSCAGPERAEIGNATPRDAPRSAALATMSPLLIGVQPLDLHDRYLGAMFGLAVGDALGTTLEFEPPGSFRPIADMVGGGPFGLKPGQWTDDTSMALCLAESLVHVGASDPADQMRRYVAWWKKGHLSATGTCFDIGGTTSGALARFKVNGNPLAGSKAADSAGNGSLMRLAPIPLAYRADVHRAVQEAALSSRTTHGAAEAVDACRFMALVMTRALAGASKDELLRKDLWDDSRVEQGDPLAPKVRAVVEGSYKRKKPPAIKGSGYVVDCLEAALWAFCHHDGYEPAVLAAVNLGDDADTTAAVCGQLAGCYYGITGIPGRWVERIALRDTIAELARGLLVLSRSFDSKSHVRGEGASAPDRAMKKMHEQRLVGSPSPSKPSQLDPDIDELWRAKDEARWKASLQRYWESMDKAVRELAQGLEPLDLARVRAMDANAWYAFLHNEYFPWKYTDKRRLTTTRKSLSWYRDTGHLAELLFVKEQLLNLSMQDIQGALTTAQSIRGLGVAGASGLLALMYPGHFATVDQFVVKALRGVTGLPQRDALSKMKPEGLQPKDGAILIEIMRQKAAENNERFHTDFWTPKKIDEILWTYGR